MFQTKEYSISLSDHIVNKILVAELSKEFCTIDIFYKTERVYNEVKQEITTFVEYLKKQPYIRTNQDKYIFNVVDNVYFSDKFGDWSYSPLQNQILILLKLSVQQPFPEYIRLSENIQPNLIKDEKMFQANQNYEKQMRIEKFIEKIGKVRNIPQNDQNTLIDQLKDDQSVQTVDDLLLWNDEDWNQMQTMSKTYKQYIKRELAKLPKQQLSNQLEQNLSEAQLQAIIHKIKRYLIWRSNDQQLDLLKTIGYLHENAAELASEEMKQQYQGPELLDKLQEYFKTFCIPKKMSDSLQFSRGIILYGPPGTGKTWLTSKMADLLGFTPIGPDIGAADVNKGKVGETELLLRNLVNRARKLPYLMCSLSIDEVDSLASKRDDKQTEHKTDHLSTLLGLIGGITDVPNITLFTSTNNFNKIDTAFSRRLSGSFFVGNPGPESRKQILFQEKDRTKTQITEKNIPYILKLTTNYSGAATKAFLSDVIKTTIYQKKKNPANLLTKFIFQQLANETAKQFRIFIGSYTLPEILEFAEQFSYQPIENFAYLVNSNIIPEDQQIRKREHWAVAENNKLQVYFDTQFEVDEEMHLQLNVETFELPVPVSDLFQSFVNYGHNQSEFILNTDKINNTFALINQYSKDQFLFKIFQSQTQFDTFTSEFFQFSGKILVDCSPEEIQFQFEIKYKTKESIMIESNKKQNINATNQKFDQKQITLNYLTNFCAMRNIDFIQLFDIEFLFRNNGFDESKQCELMNEKIDEIKNYPKSMLIIDVDNLCLINENKSLSSMGISTSTSIQNQKMYSIIKNFAQSLPQINQNSETWVVLITSNSFMKEQLKISFNWPLTFKDSQQLLQQKNDYVEQICYQCQKIFTNQDNEPNCCQYHCGCVYQKSLNCLIFTDQEIVNQQKLKQQLQPDQKIAEENKTNQFFYSCCRNPEGSAGCKYGKHTNDIHKVLKQKQFEKNRFEAERDFIIKQQNIEMLNLKNFKK